MKRRSTVLGLLVLAIASLSGATAAQAQAPGKAITIYVPYPAGGISDAQSRTIAPHLSKAMGVQVVVENLSGASLLTPPCSTPWTRPMA